MDPMKLHKTTFYNLKINCIVSVHFILWKIQMVGAILLVCKDVLFVFQGNLDQRFELNFLLSSSGIFKHSPLKGIYP